MVGHFLGGSSQLERFPWPRPDPIDWSHERCRGTHAWVDFSDPSAMDDAYQAFWSQVEIAQKSNLQAHGIHLPNASLGRGKHRGPCRRVSNFVPPKASRCGEKQPAFLGSCLQHARWVRQVRRLRSFSRLARVHGKSVTHQEHACALWHSIVSAPGFPGGFRHWWTSRSHALGEPRILPLYPPASDFATLVLIGFEAELDSLESALKKSRDYAARLRRATDPYQMFVAVRKESPAQVSTLMRRVHATVVDVDPSDASISLDSEHLWLPDAPLLHSSGCVEPVVLTPDRIWLEDVTSFAVGDTITQTKHEADLPILFRAFEDQWKSLWAKHAGVPPSQWNDVLAFSAKVLPPRTCLPLQHTADSVRWHARKKMSKAAVGLDGVARSDLLALFPAEFQVIADMFAQVESHGCWPQQVVNARVSSLSKCEEPTAATHFRPITILSLVYRLWSSASSQHWISCFDEALDSFLCGNRSGFRAATAWRHVLSQVELHRVNGQPATGLVLDLVKAFNQVPRLPTLHACKLLGMHQNTLVAWAGMLAQVCRHFQIDGSCSPGVRSSCGLPEGCGMSCVGMLALTEVFHRWIKALELPLYAISYVDDWQIFLQNPAHMQAALERVDQFIAAWDMARDCTKTYAWSTDPDVRKQLREANHSVLLSARALGAHVTYTRQLSNGTTLARFGASAPSGTPCRPFTVRFSRKFSSSCVLPGLELSMLVRRLSLVENTFRVCVLKLHGLSNVISLA